MPADDDVEARFLAAIDADPEDDDARLVYADWLAERGDPRAEYVRLEVTLYRAPQRLRELAHQLDPVWIDRVARRFRVVLCEVGSGSLIKTVKTVRETTGLGLRDAKLLVDDVYSGTPMTVRDDLTYTEAHELAAKFEPAKVRVEKSPRET